MDSFLYNTFFLIARYLHIVCSTVLVGGTLFYEMVVPPAIDELRPEHQLAVFARARLIFRRLVWVCAALLILTGVANSYLHWDAYYQGGQATQVLSGTGRYIISRPPPIQRPDWWWVGHSSTGIVAVLIAVYLTSGNRPPERPVQWMRLNLVILLVVIFLGTTARHVRDFFQQGTSTPVVQTGG